MVIQFIGWFGMAAFLISYQTKSNRTLFALQALGAGLFCLQFSLMHAYSGCFSLVLTLLRSIMLRYYKEQHWIQWYGWSIVFTAGFLGVMLMTWSGPAGLLTFTASALSSFCYWTNNAGKIRLGNLCVSSPCWIAYDIIVGSWGGVASEAFTMMSIIVSIRRFGWKSLLEEI